VKRSQEEIEEENRVLERIRENYPTPMSQMKPGSGLRRKNTIIDSNDYHIPSGKETARETGSVSGRVTTDVVKMMDSLVASKTTKFGTRGELVAAAVYWFIVEKIMPKAQTGRIHQGMKLMIQRTQAAKTMAENLDLQEFQVQHRRMLERLVALGAIDDAVVEYRRMIDIAKEIHSRFEERVQAWAEMEPSFAKIREEIAAATGPGPKEMCGCGHFARDHDGETGTFPGECLETDCVCTEWHPPGRHDSGRRG
jgi:hypothetical protein